MTALLTLPEEILQLITASLKPQDIYALRLLSRLSFRIFAGPSLCDFLLKLHFPFSHRLHDTAYDTLNALLLRRRRIECSYYTQSFDYPTFRDFDADLGALLTAEEDEARDHIDIAIRWVGEGGRSILVPGPLRIEHSSPPPEIVLSRDRVLILYQRGTSGTMALILEGRFSGATLWNAFLFMTVYTAKRKLRPIFNKHYLAFITAASAPRLVINRFTEATPLLTLFQVRPSNVCELRADEAGKYVFVGEVFPSNNNLHRIVLVDALTGMATKAFQLPMAESFASAPRDWGFDLSPDELSLLAWQSPRDETYRAKLALQVSIFSLEDGKDAVSKIRYLLAPSSSLSAQIKHRAKLTISYNFAMSVASMGRWLLLYPPLNLTHHKAGSGEFVNKYNMLSPLAHGQVPAMGSEPESVQLGRDWIAVTSHDWDGRKQTQLLRLSNPVPSNGTLTGISTPASASGISTPNSVMMAGDHIVDAGDLTRRLAAMQKDSGSKAKRRSGLRVSQIYQPELEQTTQEIIPAFRTERGLSLAEADLEAAGTGWAGLATVAGKLSGAVKRAKSEASALKNSVGSKQEVEYAPVINVTDTSQELGRAKSASVSIGGSGKKGWRGRLFGKSS
ncbi:hypothetical protein FN846DRAFT_936142 [Sphaerosporella brunnea]|uniref:F-box domain-containing protein n=1 Tax=Sphaerosporella brunnea TaxID=1250544 RepID=A0A5J5F4N1_9PEZI|nr:hypothetical protein FN846DRAFT_936142 [Sphaerosporella brunnea]